jgi:aminoglycoside phosphotransferase (APT) family kinase protein
MDLLGAGLVPLDGGHSGETFLAEAAGERSVVRIYAGRGATRGVNAPEVDAAVLRLVRGLVPVPEVLEVRRADPSAGTPGLLVTSHLPGRRLDEVLPGADDALAAALGAAVAAVVCRLAQMPMPRAGLFLDGELRIGPMPPAAQDLPAWVDAHLTDTSLSRWSSTERAGLAGLAEEAQDLADQSTRVCLVHSDLNPKNLLVDPGTATVTGVLDWEFAHAGSPFSDLGNLLRFAPRHPSRRQSCRRTPRTFRTRPRTWPTALVRPTCGRWSTSLRGRTTTRSPVAPTTCCWRWRGPAPCRPPARIECTRKAA